MRTLANQTLKVGGTTFTGVTVHNIVTETLMEGSEITRTTGLIKPDDEHRVLVLREDDWKLKTKKVWRPYL